MSQHPAPDTVLALVGDELKQGLAAREGAAGKAGDVLVYEVTKRDLPKWVAEQFARPVSRRATTRAAHSSSSSVRTSRSSRARSTSSPPGPRRDAIGDGRGRAACRGARGDAALRAHRRLGPPRRRRGLLARGRSAARALDRARASCTRSLPLAAHVAPGARLPDARRGGRRPRDAAAPAEDAPVRRREGVRSGAELLGRGAARRDRPARRASTSRSRAAAGSGDLELERTLVAIDRRRPSASEPLRSCRRRAARPAPSCARRCSCASAPRAAALSILRTSSRCSAATCPRRRRRPRPRAAASAS